MDKGIDASLGLDVALLTLQRLRKHGRLQAEVSHIPGVRGRYHCSIEIVEGKVTSCILEDTTGNRYPAGIDVIVVADQKKGPFSWVFRPQVPAQSQPFLPGLSQAVPATDGLSQQKTQHLPRQDSDTISSSTIPIPLKRASDLSRLTNLHTNETVMLGWIFSLVDGQRTVADITVMLSRLRFEDVKSGLLFLKQIGVIALREQL